jgi:hypothetical protein
MELKSSSLKLDKILIFTILLIVAITLLNSCGPGTQRVPMANSAVSPDAVTTPDISNQTGGMTDSGRPYLTLSSPDEVQKAQQAVAMTLPNQEFAKQFESVHTKVSSEGKVSFEVVGKSQSKLIFQGALAVNQNNKFVGQFTDSTGQRPDLTFDVSCDDQVCSNAHVVVKDQQNHMTVALVKSWDSSLHIAVPYDEDETELAKSGFLPWGQDSKVKVYSTEFFPGKTHIEVDRDSPEHEVLFNSEVHETEGDEDVPVQVGQNDSTSTVTASVEGFDDKEIDYKVSRVMDPKKPQQTQVAYYKIRTPNGPQTPSVTVDIPKQCLVRADKIKGGVHPLVAKILHEDCGDWRLASDMKTWQNPKSDMLFFLNLHEQSKLASPVGKAKDFKLVANTLHSNNLPMIWTTVPLHESSFIKTKVNPGKYHEVGLWQILPETADKILHISREDSFDPVLSTQAASTYINGFLKIFNNDVKLTLASYNAGSVAKRLTGDHPLTQEFWYMCDIHKSINKDFSSTCNYVKKILSAMITSLDPEAFGVANSEALEAE